MRRRNRWLLAIAGVLLLVTAGGWVLLETQAGLRWSLALVEQFTGGKLHIKRADGRLVGPLVLSGVEYRHKGTTVTIDRLRFDWSPSALLFSTVRIDQLHVDGGRLTIAPSKKAAASSTSLPVPPFPVRLVDGRLSDITVVRAGSKPVVVKQLILRGVLRRDRLEIDKLALSLQGASLRASGTVGLARRVQTALNVDWTARGARGTPAAGQGTLWGNWRVLKLDQQLSEPTPAHIEASVEQPMKAPRWQLAVNVPAFALRKLNPRWANDRAALHLQGHGTLADATLKGTLSTDVGAGELYPVTLSAQLSREPAGVIRIGQLDVKLPGQGALGLTGQLTEASRRFDLHAQWQHLGWPLRGTLSFASATGSATLKGTLADYELGVSAQLSGRNIPAGHWQLQGRGTERHLQIHQLHGALLKGSLDGSGTLTWKPKAAWDLTFSAKGIDPGERWPTWPGQVAARAQTRGQIEADGPHGVAVLAGLSGKLRGYALRGGATIKLAGRAVDVTRLQLESGTARFTARGKLARQVQLAWSLDAPRLEQLLPGWKGSLTGSGTASGPRAAPRFAAQIRGSHIAGPSLQAGKLSAHLDASVDPAQRSSVLVRAEGLRVRDRSFASAVLKGEGNQGAQQLSLVAQGPDNALDIRVGGRVQNKRWTGRLDHAAVRLSGFGDWALLRPVPIEIGADQRKLSAACWKSGTARLCLDAEQTVGRYWTAKVSVDKLPLAQLAGTLSSAMRINGTVSAQLRARRNAGEPLQAAMSMLLPPGTVAYRGADGKEIPVAYQGGKLQASVAANGLDATAALRLEGTDRVDVDLHVPGFGSKEAALRAQPMRGTVHAHIDKLGMLAALTQGIGEPAGAVDINLKLAGTLAKPELRGTAQLTNGAFDVLPMGIKVRQVSLHASADPDGRLQFRGQAKSGKGSVTLDGSGDIAGAARWQGRLHLVGQDFEALNTSDGQVSVSPDLTLRLSPGRLDVQGQVTVPQAEIHPTQIASGTVGVSPDVVIVSGGKPAKAASALQVSTQVRLVLGDKVNFKGFGLAGRLTGAVQVVARPGTVTTGRGQVAIKNGTYRAYGQDLTIQQGQFLFAGGPIDDPGINVRAVRQIMPTTTGAAPAVGTQTSAIGVSSSAAGTITAGVQVTGTAKNPQLTLFSTPAMSQSETLSYLLTGHGLGNASASEGALLMAAASSLGIKGGDLLAGHIGELFGLQEARIESGGSLKQSSLVLGKYLAPDLYVSYSVGLAEAVNQLRIRYQFARHWALQTETGLQTGADLLYTLER